MVIYFCFVFPLQQSIPLRNTFHHSTVFKQMSKSIKYTVTLKISPQKERKKRSEFNATETEEP